MQVETYEVTEQFGIEKHEDEAEAIALIRSLGLEGQQSRLSNVGGSAQANPYRKMTREEAFVYSRICPQRTDVNRYESGWIPLRVLQVIAHAKPLFAHLVILHPEDVRIDPVLVGTAEKYGAHGDHILARWGDVLEPLDVLRERAVAGWRKEYAEKIAKIASQAVALKSVVVPEETIIRGAQIPYAHGEGF